MPAALCFCRTVLFDVAVTQKVKGLRVNDNFQWDQIKHGSHNASMQLFSEYLIIYIFILQGRILKIILGKKLKTKDNK